MNQARKSPLTSPIGLAVGGRVGLSFVAHGPVTPVLPQGSCNDYQGQQELP